MLLLTGVNNRNGLKVAKMVAISRIVEEGWQDRPATPPAGGACESPVPRVVNRAPRVFKKTSNGVTGGVVAGRYRHRPS